MAWRTLLRRVKYGLRRAVYWARLEEGNWGDEISPWLYERLRGVAPMYCPHRDVPRVLMAGSVLEEAGPHDTCWGSGAIQARPQRRLTLGRAVAVRGPLTADLLEKCGAASTEVYGDPGLLVADFVDYDLTKQVKCAVIPHYADFQEGQQLAECISAEVIPVCLPVEEFVRRVARAELVLSSSLHGIVCAESLGTPAVWIALSARLTGGAFKFNDYFLGTGRKPSECRVVDLKARTAVAPRLKRSTPLPTFDLAAVKQRLLAAFEQLP